MTETSIVPPVPDYTERIVTFIDLLGFSRDVILIDQHPGLLLSIDAVLSAIVRCKRDLDTRRESDELEYDARLNQISDALVLSYRIERGAFGRAISHAAFLGNVCRRGYLPRGIITTGKLVHDADRLYGRGLIDAYDAERHSVIEPRIAIDARVMEEFRKEFAQEGQIGRAASFTRNRSTGEFVHILGRDWSFLKKMATKGDDGVSHMFDELRQMLPLRYRNAENDAQRCKIEWMSAYVNDTIDEQNLPGEWKVVLPNAASRQSRAMPNANMSDDPARAFAIRRSHDQANAANENSRPMALYALLINGAAASAVIAFLSKEKIDPEVVALAPYSLLCYAVGVVIGVIGMFCMTESLDHFSHSWRYSALPGGNPEAEKRRGTIYWWAVRVAVSLSILSFAAGSCVLAYALTHTEAANNKTLERTGPWDFANVTQGRITS